MIGEITIIAYIDVSPETDIFVMVYYITHASALSVFIYSSLQGAGEISDIVVG